MGAYHDEIKIKISSFVSEGTALRTAGQKFIWGNTYAPGEDVPVAWHASQATPASEWAIHLLVGDEGLVPSSMDVLKHVQENGKKIFTHIMWVNENVDEHGWVA